MTVAELPIQIDREKIAEFCRTHGIRRLSLFGSVLRNDFDPARSDVDVLANYCPPHARLDFLDGTKISRLSSDAKWTCTLPMG